ncbi:unnamed protein product [Calicophoron daubneyi]
MEIYNDVAAKRRGIVKGLDLRSALMGTGLEGAKIDTLLTKLDPTGHGEISREGYKRAIGCTPDYFMRWRSTFDRFDQDNSRTITLDEIKPILQNMEETMTHDAVLDWIDKHDTNHDGKFDLREFQNFMDYPPPN